ncbi:MAG: DUF420 domain-containing protein [Acidobacteria bacterium]|nr:DUF420 domain-containing protein [Acidobacteriota bacterium]MBI3656126.1 DUF420 domain-containing protein [Acidobacteriota bacterium]
MISVTDLPALNASLNGTTAIFLLMGFAFIRRRMITQHKICMMLATLASAVFLVSYLVYHYYHGASRFSGQGWIRPVYFFILISHTLLAAPVLAPMVIITLKRAWSAEFAKHKKLARWTLPIWLYVSITGLLVYGMLYHLYPAR